MKQFFLPIPLRDALEIIQTENDNIPVEFTCSGLPVAGDDKDNLCVRAYWLLKKSYTQLPPVKMHLLKAIPVGAGLGGGSADGAFALAILNKKFNLGIPDGQLVQYALQLGSDCPFFIINKPCFAQQRGEKLEQIELNLAAYKLLIVNPGIHVSTSWAFSQIRPAQPVESIREIICRPVAAWKDGLVNDFERPVINHHPVLGEIKARLYSLGAVYAGMSGSGSTFFGIFEKNILLKSNAFPSGYFVKELSF